MNRKGFFKNTASDIFTGLAIAIFILALTAGIALAAQQTKPLRDFRLDLAANTQIQVEYFKVPRIEIYLGEQYISAE